MGNRLYQCSARCQNTVLQTGQRIRSPFRQRSSRVQGPGPFRPHYFSTSHIGISSMGADLLDSGSSSSSLSVSSWIPWICGCRRSWNCETCVLKTRCHLSILGYSSISTFCANGDWGFEASHCSGIWPRWIQEGRK